MGWVTPSICTNQYFDFLIGGTVDIIIHKILDDGKIAEVYKASGGAWGGTVIDEEFRKYLSKKFDVDNCLEKF